jgi:hypothetical protein
MFSFNFSTPAPNKPIAMASADVHLFAVNIDGDGPYYLDRQLDADIRNQCLGVRPSGWRLMDLFDLQRLLRPFVHEEIANVIMSADDLRRLTKYAMERWLVEYESENLRVEHAYDQMLECLICPTLIRFVL